MKIYRLTSFCGGYGKPKGHLDTQMFPECENKPGDRDVAKKNRKRKEKKKKKEKTASINKVANWYCNVCDYQWGDEHKGKPTVCPKCGEQEKSKFGWNVKLAKKKQLKKTCSCKRRDNAGCK